MEKKGGSGDVPINVVYFFSVQVFPVIKGFLQAQRK